MTKMKQYPVLGIDTPAWLTSRDDGNGRRSYFIGSGTTNQRLNLPAAPLAIKSGSDWNELIQVEFDTEMLSGMDDASSLSRKIDYMFACSRCAINVRVLSGLGFLEGSTPLIIRAEELIHPHVEHLQVRLDVESVCDLAKLYCRLGRGDYDTLSQSYPLENGSLLTLCHGLETCVLKLDSTIGSREYEATLYTQTANPPGLDLVLKMPTFESSQRIGVIMP